MASDTFSREISSTLKGEDFFDISIESIFYDMVRNEDVFPTQTNAKIYRFLQSCQANRLGAK